jgi:hypothetical protein
MDKHVDQQRDVVRRTLDDYLSERPDACDTIEGIKMWWLQEVETDMTTIEHVLNEMVEEGALQRIRVSADVEVFRRSTERSREEG